VGGNNKDKRANGEIKLRKLNKINSRFAMSLMLMHFWAASRGNGAATLS